jgi:hypothetical protein
MKQNIVQNDKFEYFAFVLKTVVLVSDEKNNILSFKYFFKLIRKGCCMIWIQP